MTEDHQMTDRERWIALVVLCTGMLMIVLDGTIVNVALPTISTELDLSDSGLAWVVNAYLIPFGGLLLLAGRLGDLLGRRSMFLVGLAVFTAASVLCGLAQEGWMLIGARFLQGAGGAFSTAVILGVIITMFPDPAERAKAIGVYAFVASAGGSVGLLLGGVLTSSLSWHWVFLVNVPIGIAAALAALRVLPRDRGLGWAAGADIPGAVLITTAVMSGVYGVVSAADHGWGAWQVPTFLALSLALVAAFIRCEQVVAQPLVPLRVFRSRNVTGANLIQVFMIAGFFGIFFLGALYLQRVLDYSAFEVGVAFLPMMLLFGGLSVSVSDKLQMRFGAKWLLPPGLLCIAASLALMTRAPVDGQYFTDIMPSMILLGIGGGLAAPALVTIAMSGATAADSGLASGLVNTTAQVGGAIGLAVLSTLSTTRTRNEIDGGSSAAEAAVSGYHLAFGVATALVIVAIVLVFVLIERESEAAPVGDPAQAAGEQALVLT